MPRVIVLRGPDAGKQFPVAANVTVGRHSANPVHLHDTRVSRAHCEITSADGGFQLRDLGSGNGTLLNGQPITATALRAGDQITLGDTVLLFAGDAAPAHPFPVELLSTPDDKFLSTIVRTVRDTAGSLLLGDPGRADGDWLRKKLATLGVLYEATTAVSHILDVDELLNRILELVVRSCEADHGCCLVIDAETGAHMPRAVWPPGQPLSVSRTVVDHVLTRREGVLSADAAADDRFAGGASVVRNQFREVICVPMRGRHETVGVLFLDTIMGRARFTADHLDLAIAVAHQAALAVEETRYYQALLNAERLAAVGQTIAGLSHHIKNVQQGVRFGGDMIRTGLAEDDRNLVAKGWTLVEKNQKRIDDLILDMLNYSKEREPDVAPVDLPALIQEVLDVVRGRAADRGVSLTYAVARLPPVPCDAEGIHRALLNVVSNALDAAEGTADAAVTVEAMITAEGRYAEITVVDTGPGVPPVKRDDIFKPFVSTKGNRGTGLGLPVSRKVLREHGGDLFVIDGIGGRFVLRLPMRES